jgi:hypothetical protein
LISGNILVKIANGNKLIKWDWYSCLVDGNKLVVLIGGNKLVG